MSSAVIEGLPAAVRAAGRALLCDASALILLAFPLAAFVVFLVLGSIAYDVLCPIGAMLGAGYGAADLILIFSAM